MQGIAEESVASSLPLRILYISRFDTGGAVESLKTTLKHLDKERFQPSIVFYRENRYAHEFRRLGIDVRCLQEALDPKGLPTGVGRVAGSLKTFRSVRVVNKLIRRDFPLAWKIRKEIVERQPNLVCHNDNLRAHRAAVLGAAMAGVTQVCHARSLTEFFRPIDILLSRLVRHYVYISTAVQSQYESELGVPEERGTVIWDPVEIDCPLDANEARERLESEYHLHDSGSILCNVGRIVSRKGQDVFLKALAALAGDYPDLRALIVGESDASAASRGFERKLHSMARELGLLEHVRFTGHLDDVALAMLGSDVVVHSATRPEGLGRVVIEAMLLGRPVVATKAGGIMDIVVDGESGLLAPMGDADALAAALRQFLANPERAEAMAARGQKVAQERFGVDRHVARLEGLFEHLLLGSAGSGVAADG